MNRRRPLVLAASIFAVALVCVPIALAGKKPGGGTTGGSYTITLSPTGSYYFGESVYATTNVPESLGPFISMKCYQNGVLVGTTDHAAFPGGWYFGWAFSLGPSAAWTGGAADCAFTVTHSGRVKPPPEGTPHTPLDAFGVSSR